MGFPRMYIAKAYIRAIVTAGGIPFLIPMGLTEDAIIRLVTRLDGVLFTGGGDIHPENYGAKSNTLCKDVDPERDRLEIFLLRNIIQAPKPFLGICRGIQLINVALGGSLYSDISTERPNSMEHRHARTDLFTHQVKITLNSRLIKIIGDGEIAVNSRHHQGINTLAAGLKAVAFAPDGIIEGIELPAYPGIFGIGVQWHPEDMLEQPSAKELFKAFVKAAREFAY